MKKYLLSTCLCLSVHVYAYEGATTEFTKEVFKQAMTQSLLTNLQSHETSKQVCAINIVTPAMDGVAEEYVQTVLTDREERLMDELFNEPLGQNMLNQARLGNLNDLGEKLDSIQYDSADYVRYKQVMEKYFDTEQLNKILSTDAIKEAMLISAIKCRIVDF